MTGFRPRSSRARRWASLSAWPRAFAAYRTFVDERVVGKRAIARGLVDLHYTGAENHSERLLARSSRSKCGSASFNHEIASPIASPSASNVFTGVNS